MQVPLVNHSETDPKLLEFLWSITQNALPLGANLQRRGIQSEAFFKRCQAVETAMHTFFSSALMRERFGS